MGAAVGTCNIPNENQDGIYRLLTDLVRVLDEQILTDIVFLLGKEEVAIHAHRLMMTARCKSFQNTKIGEVCRIPIPGCTVYPPTTPGGPTAIRLPQVHEETFMKFLAYVYTGGITLEDNEVFEIMSLAQDLGVETLVSRCEDYITSKLSPLSAAKFLAAAVDAQERTSGGKYTQSFIDRCLAYVGENAKECVKTDSFLTLPKDVLIKLLSSDCFALEEEDVWRAVLNWAKYQAGVTQPTAHWTEEERLRVCHHLNGVINHVRLLLIDSKVFAEEVEPTGAIPIELSLEKYRYAALPDKFKEENEDERLKPRMLQKLFPESQILVHDKLSYQKIIGSWYGNPKQCWELLYRASTHESSAEAFHHHCDGIAPVIVIVLGSDGQVCGGFSDVPWVEPSVSTTYIASEKAFLFTFSKPPRKFHVTKKNFALCYHKDCGPVFGAGADLYISDNCHNNTDSYSNLPHSYEGENATASSLMGKYYFQVADYEVYKLREN